MKVLNALSGFICRGHGYETIAAPAWAASICHHFGTNNLQIQDVYSNTSSIWEEKKKKKKEHQKLNKLTTKKSVNYGGRAGCKKTNLNSTKH